MNVNVNMDARANIGACCGQDAGPLPSLTAAGESCVDGGDPVHVHVAVKVHVDVNGRPSPPAGGSRHSPGGRA